MTLKARVNALGRRRGQAAYPWAVQGAAGLWTIKDGPAGLTTEELNRLGIVKRYVGLSPDDWDAQVARDAVGGPERHATGQGRRE